MVGDQQVGAGPQRLVRDLLDRVDGEQHPADLGLRVTADQPDGVPGLGQRRRVGGFQDGDDLGELHGGRLGRRRPRTSRPRPERPAQPAQRKVTCVVFVAAFQLIVPPANSLRAPVGVASSSLVGRPSRLPVPPSAM